MAYCRWSECDVYVYKDVGDRQGEIRCCSCNLRFVAHPVGGVYETPYPSFIARGPREMIDHLREHEAVGHRVPKRAFTSLSKEARERTKSPIKYPVHFLVSKMETVSGEVIDSILGAMPLCGYHNNAHFRKLLRIKKETNGHAHPRDETTLNKKKVTCSACKAYIKTGLTAVPYTKGAPTV